jgi:hypothetical protein
MRMVERFLILGFEIKVFNHTDQNKVVFPEDWNNILTGTMFAKNVRR